jgi:hypothetical protein
MQIYLASLFIVTKFVIITQEESEQTLSLVATMNKYLVCFSLFWVPLIGITIKLFVEVILVELNFPPLMNITFRKTLRSARNQSLEANSFPVPS